MSQLFHDVKPQSSALFQTVQFHGIALNEIMPIMKDERPLPNNLRLLLKELEIKQLGLASLWRCEPGHVTKILQGKVRVTQEKQLLLYKKYGITFEMLFGPPELLKKAITRHKMLQKLETFDEVELGMITDVIDTAIARKASSKKTETAAPDSSSRSKKSHIIDLQPD
jgi:transcriptional regulator with XRE-family HTH domain